MRKAQEMTRGREAKGDHKLKEERMGQKFTRNRDVLRYSIAGRQLTEVWGGSERKEKWNE